MTFRCLFIGSLMVLAAPLITQASAEVAMTGRLKYTYDYAPVRENGRNEPSLGGRLVLDSEPAAWRLHVWLEGGRDATVSDSGEDRNPIKRFDKVYQASPWYLDLKELFTEQRLAGLDWRLGVQRLAWGRLDEYPINDLFNPWDFGQFIVRPMEERKIGVPALTASQGLDNWSYQLAWVPWLVPYRLPDPGSRWSLSPRAEASSPGLKLRPLEPDRPARTIANSNIGLRLQHQAAIDWAISLFHGFDPRPAFATTNLTVSETADGLVVDPGYVPAFHRISSLGLDGAMVVGELSLRAEAAYTRNRSFNLRPDLWGYPATFSPGIFPLNQVEVFRDTLDYGLAADYRPFEDGLLTVQAQQTVILDRPPTLYERSFETLLWANLKVDWLNQKIATSLNLAFNPEHGANLFRAALTYLFTDHLKTGATALFLHGPPQSLFGRYSMNDQIGLEVVYGW